MSEILKKKYFSSSFFAWRNFINDPIFLIFSPSILNFISEKLKINMRKLFVNVDGEASDDDVGHVIKLWACLYHFPHKSTCHCRNNKHSYLFCWRRAQRKFFMFFSLFCISQNKQWTELFFIYTFQRQFDETLNWFNPSRFIWIFL